jgi:hypothetical protein
VAREAGVDPRALREVLHLRAERRDQAVVVERRGAQLARQVQQLLHRLVGEALGLLQLGPQRVRGVHRRRLEAQQDAGQRLVDLVVEVLGDPRALPLLPAQHRTAGLAALVLEAGEHAVEAGGQLLDLARRPARLVGAHAGGVQIDLVHGLDEALHRLQTAADQQRVQQHRAEDGEREQQQAVRAGRVAQAVAGDDRRHDRGHADQQRVDGQDLGKKRARAHQRSYRPFVQGALWGPGRIHWLYFLKH